MINLSKYFGAMTSYRQYVIRVRWAFGLMFMLILLLSAAVISLARDARGGQTAQAATPLPAPTPVPTPEIPKATIAMATEDITLGRKLSKSMFGTREVPEELVPEGVLLWNDIERLEGKFARKNINAKRFVDADAIAETQPITAFNIPPGSRAVTILADKKTSVEGFVQPGSMVDVLWVYQDGTEGRNRIATIVRFVRVLSVAGDTGKATERGEVQTTGEFPVTILASEKDAKVIQLAASMGQLSLSLVGDGEKATDTSANDTAIVSLADVLKKEKLLAPPRATTKNPTTGKDEVFVLREGVWVPAEEASKDSS